MPAADENLDGVTQQKSQALKAALALNSQLPEHAQAKKQALQAYFGHLAQVPENNIDITPVLSILAYSHTNPELAIEALTDYNAAQHKKAEEPIAPAPSQVEVVNLNPNTGFIPNTSLYKPKPSLPTNSNTNTKSAKPGLLSRIKKWFQPALN